MAVTRRDSLICELENLRGSRVITLFTGDRTSVVAPLGEHLVSHLESDLPEVLYRHLRQIGKSKKLDLFLYTRGGHVDSVWPIVAILRQFTLDPDGLSVLVPYRAHSAGTLLCLGADRIVMGDLAELSPIDPVVGNAFNPIDESTRQRRGISVEDVTSYMNLAKDTGKVGLTESGHLLEVFKRLSEEVHPLALGYVYRAHTQIRDLATRLLAPRFSGTDEQRIDRIVNSLSSSLYSHTHAIVRAEARELLGDLVCWPSEQEQEIMWALYQSYSDDMQLRTPLCLESGPQTQDLALPNAYVESHGMSSTRRSQMRVIRYSQLPANVQVQVPPGQPLPLIPGLPTTYAVESSSRGWEHTGSREEGAENGRSADILT